MIEPLKEPKLRVLEGELAITNLLLRHQGLASDIRLEGGGLYNLRFGRPVVLDVEVVVLLDFVEDELLDEGRLSVVQDFRLETVLQRRGRQFDQEHLVVQTVVEADALKGGVPIGRVLGRHFVRLHLVHPLDVHFLLESLVLFQPIGFLFVGEHGPGLFFLVQEALLLQHADDLLLVARVDSGAL